jgi:hypothetical protein
MTRQHRFVALSALVLALAASAMAQDNNLADRVTVQSGGEYLSYPPAGVSRREASVVYAIDMTTANSRLTSAEEEAVSMTWAQADDIQTVCFEHAGDSVCRSFPVSWNADVPPRFIPTLSARWPTIYARFSTESGSASWIVYVQGEIISRDEEIQRMRAANPAPQ